VSSPGPGRRADRLRQRRPVQVHRTRHQGRLRPWRRVGVTTASPLRAAAGSVIAGQGCSLKGPDGPGADEPSVQARYPGLLPGWPASASIVSRAYRIAPDPGGERHCGRRYSDHDRAHSGFAERCPYRRRIRRHRRAHRGNADLSPARPYPRCERLRERHCSSAHVTKIIDVPQLART